MNLGKYSNLLSTIALILSAITGIMAKLLNCSSTGDLTAVCTGSGLIPTQYLGIVAGTFAVLGLILKSVRPGGFINSMFGQTAVVVPDAKSAPGVVTPAQVASK